MSATSSSLNQAVRGAAYAAPVSPDLPEHGTAGVLPARTVRLLTPHASASPPIPARTVLYLRWVTYGLILVLSACLEFIGLDQEGYANTYYAAGVKSMLPAGTTSSMSPSTAVASSRSTNLRLACGSRLECQALRALGTELAGA